MESMIKHISNLLYLNDCVIVPGLGSFLGNYRSTLFREELNLFLPPAKEIGFNRSLAFNDGLLANFIAKKESVKYEEAVEKINIFVKSLKLNLLSYKTVTLGEIGFFKIDAGGNLLFVPNQESSFLPEALGLSSFRFFPLEHKRISKIEFKDEKLLKTKNYSIKNWAAAAIFIACFFLFSIDIKTPDISQAGFSYNFFNTNDFSTQIFENEIITSEIHEVISDSNVVENSILPSKKFHIIVASHTRYNQATTSLNDFISEGFSNVKIIEANNGRFRISLFSFADKEVAQSVLDDVKKQSHFSDAWLLTVRD